MILTGSAIREECQNGRIMLNPFLEENVNPNSYNFRLDRVLKTYKNKLLDPKKPQEMETIVMGDEGFIIEPYKLYLANTIEEIGSDFYAPTYNAMETWKTPVVIKPSDRSASKGVVIVRDSKDIEAAYKESLLYSKNKEILVEEYIEGIEYCAEYFIVDSTPYIMAVSEKEVLNEKYCVELKDVTPARLPLEDYDKINKYLSKVIRAIGFNNGIVHIELKKENDMISIIEINSRCAGGNLLESVYHLSGYNPYTNLANLLCKVRDEVSIPKLIDYNADSLFTIFDTFSYKGRSGVIKKIENTQVFNEIKRYPEEKFFLYVNKGNFVGETENNEDSIGSIYLMDKEYDSLITRCKQLEDSIGVYVGDE